MTNKAKPVQSTKTVKTIRNVLVQPFKTQWPSVGEAEGTKLVNLLEQIAKDQVVHGMNPVNHLLSRGLACALFITSDFHPQILGKQIIQMARRNSPAIQILALEGLSWNGKQEKLVAVRNASHEYSENVIDLLNLMVAIGDSKGYVVDRSESSSIKNKKPGQKAKVRNMSLEEIAQLYIPRPKNGKRAFVPQVSIFAGKQTAETKKSDWGPFISFKRPRSEQNESRSKNESKIKTKSPSSSINANTVAPEAYEPLTVNRVQGNPNRKQDKRKKK